MKKQVERPVEHNAGERVEQEEPRIEAASGCRRIRDRAARRTGLRKRRDRLLNLARRSKIIEMIPFGATAASLVKSRFVRPLFVAALTCRTASVAPCRWLSRRMRADSQRHQTSWISKRRTTPAGSRSSILGNESRPRVLSCEHWHLIYPGVKKGRPSCPKNSTRRLTTNMPTTQSRPCKPTNNIRSLKRDLRIPFQRLTRSAKLNQSRQRIDFPDNYRRSYR